MTEKNYVVNIKTKQGTIVTVRGDTSPELRANIDSFVENGLDASIAMLEGVVLDVVPFSTQTTTSSAVNIVQDAFGPMEVTETPVTPSFAPVPPPQQTAVPGAVETVQDKWGNSWTYGRADAPVSPNGPMVLKKGVGQSGKAYTGWFDPAGGPKWTGPKIETSAQTPPVWGVK